MAEEDTGAGKVNVLFVCLGNICRSPMAEAVFRHVVASQSSDASSPHPLIHAIDSAGTGAYHVGSNPDPRTTATLDANGIDDYVHASRQVREADFEDFDYILGMDSDNVSNLKFMKARIVHRRGGSEQGLARVELFGDYGGKKRKGGKGEEVDDPYYGGDEGFETAYEQMGRFSRAFLKELADQEKEGKL